jgi:alkylation response protein AidB-like acyl-CoA dehydrogenase
MDFSTSAEATAFRSEVKQFIADTLTEEMFERERRTGTSHIWELHRAIAEKGWIAAALPPALGGQGRGPEEMAALQEELEIAHAPVEGMGCAMAISSILSHAGNEFHKHEIVPRLVNGEIIACLGYSEPESGSDVAAAVTKATPQGDNWIINGQKVFTSLAEESAYVFLLTRTSSEGRKHEGLTFFIVPLDLPGIEIQAIHTLSGKRTNITYYSDVVVPDIYRVGEVDGGWNVMLVALAFERGVVGGAHYCLPLLETAVRYATAVDADGVRPCDDPSVMERVVRLAIDSEVASALGARAAWVASSGALPGAEGTLARLFATEAYTRGAQSLIDIAGPAGVLEGPGGAVGGEFEHAYRFAPVTTVYGGTAEIQKNLIAERVLGLPRARRA